MKDGHLDSLGCHTVLIVLGALQIKKALPDFAIVSIIALIVTLCYAH